MSAITYRDLINRLAEGWTFVIEAPKNSKITGFVIAARHPGYAKVCRVTITAAEEFLDIPLSGLDELPEALIDLLWFIRAGEPYTLSGEGKKDAERPD